ncbi:MAG TPA: nicotinate-nucleotide adenylyltransferase [Candidatus Kryptonia bacterium]|nr:nicotinate-nucleotide adenylyltransferase [Candidatus Kryptonia bacterium]
MKRLGVFGGTFNPIHLAHLRSAEEVAEALHLERVLFVPSGTPPHKRHRDLAPARHRLAMVRLAIAGNPRFRVSAIEIERAGGSYSIDTVQALRRRHPTTRLFWIIGMDQFRELRTWKAYRELLRLCDFVVTSRPGFDFGGAHRELPVAVRGEFCYQPQTARLVHETGNEIIFLRIGDLDISASAIRARVRQGASIRYLLPPSIQRYIERHHLYRGRATTLADG